MEMLKKHGQSSKSRTQRQKEAEALAGAQLQQKRGNSTSVTGFQRRTQIFGGVANLPCIEPERHQSGCFLVMGQRKICLEVGVTCCFH